MEQSSPDKLDRGIIVIVSIAGLGLGADGAKGPSRNYLTFWRRLIAP